MMEMRKRRKGEGGFDGRRRRRQRESDGGQNLAEKWGGKVTLATL